MCGRSSCPMVTGSSSTNAAAFNASRDLLRDACLRGHSGRAGSRRWRSGARTSSWGIPLADSFRPTPVRVLRKRSMTLQGDRHHHGRALGVGTHLLRKAVTTMKPPTMAPGRAPPRRGVKKAIRRSGPQRSMASPRMNQPMKEENHVRGKGARTLPEGRNASSGKAAIGRSA